MEETFSSRNNKDLSAGCKRVKLYSLTFPKIKTNSITQKKATEPQGLQFTSDIRLWFCHSETELSYRTPGVVLRLQYVKTELAGRWINEWISSASRWCCGSWKVSSSSPQMGWKTRGLSSDTS